MNNTSYGDDDYRGSRRRTNPAPEGDPAPQPEWEQFRPRGRRHKPTPEQVPAIPAPEVPAQPRGRRRRPESGETYVRESAPFPQLAADAADPAGTAQLSAVGLDFVPDQDEEDEPEPPPRRRTGGRDGGTSRRAKKRDRAAKTKKKKKKKRGRILAPVLALLTLLAIVGGGGGAGYLWLRGYFAPPDFEGSGTGEVTIVVEAGESGTDIGQTLVDEGVVASVRAFTNALRLEEITDLRPGTYLLRQEMSAEAAVEALMDPDTRVGSRFTIREGLRLGQIFEEIATNTDIEVEELEEIAEDPEDVLELPDYADGTLDGYLFPDTYTLEPSAEADEALQEMLDRYEDAAAEIDFVERAEEEGFEPQEMMAIAAIIQAEAGSSGDMPKIAQVVYNRLDNDMELGMDSTCFFVLDEFGIALNGTQLRECQDSGSEYATYGRKGLPPGPIVTPGTEAMTAALVPEPGDWLYFVTTDPENGITEFAETEEEFNVLVQRFEENRGDN